MRRRVVGVLSLCAAIVACTPQSDDGRGETDADPSPVVPSLSTPAERLTPFCQAMLALDERVFEAGDADTAGLILEAYRSALPAAPAAIATEFAAIVDALERGTVATLPPTVPGQDEQRATSPAPTTAPTAGSTVPLSTLQGAVVGETITEDTFFEEGYLPDDSPAARVNEYIDFACRGNQNNPGPPATQPGAPPTSIAG